MKPSSLAFLLFLAACLTSCLATDPRPRSSSQRPAPVVPPQPSIDQQVADAEKDSRPRAEHKALELLVGTWTTRTVDVDMDGQESDQKSGTATIAWIFGGRYLKWDATLEVAPETHATTGFLGFDLFRHEYEMLTISDLSTGMGVAYGKGDIHSTGILFTLDLFDPASGTTLRAQSRLRTLDKDHVVLEVIANERIMRRTYYGRSGSPAAK